MIRMQKKELRTLRKMKTKSSAEIKTFSLFSQLKSSMKFILLFKRTFLLWCLVNFLFLYIFIYIPNGWTNSLSILWLVAYYIYWCIFIRYILQHKPYFSLVRIFNGLIPASKIMFMNISIYLLFAVIPFVPLFMGFRERYLEFFEKYMEYHNGILGTLLFYTCMVLISPFTISRPYLAWISSLVGKSRWIMDSYKRTRYNYGNFIQLAIIIALFFIISYYIDTTYKINTTIILMTLAPIYFNIVFINIYKIFYKHKAKSKPVTEQNPLQK